MSIAEKLRESLKTLVPVVPLGQNEENIDNKVAYVFYHLGPVEKNGLVPLVPNVVPTDLSPLLNNLGPPGTRGNSSVGPESEVPGNLVLAPSSGDLAQWDHWDQTKMTFPTDIQTQLMTGEDPVSLDERIGMKFGHETPGDLGVPVIRHPVDGTPLAFENDEPHVKVFAWALLNLRFARWEQLDIGKLATDCGLSIGMTRKGLSKLLEDGDLRMERDRGREYYWLAAPKY